MTIPVVLLTRSPDPDNPDEYGNPGQLETEYPTTAEIQHASASEDHGAAVEVTLWRVFLPPDAPARGWDALRVEGDATLYELTGDPWPVRHPLSGELSHLEVSAQRVE